MTLKQIEQAVEQSKKFPKAHIEYSGELPEHPLIQEDRFFGVEARYNPRVPKSVGCNVIFTY